MRKRKICVVTGTRAEYGLLTPLIKEIEKDKELELQLIVTGMHLSPEFGLTYKTIEKDFKIDKKIEILLSSDSSIGIAKSMGLAQISFSEALSELNPDLVVILGDRYEIFAVASSAFVLHIPIAHISGGELTFGVLDDGFRHAITKLSHLHFVATDEYKKRVMQLGEDEKYIFNVGEIGLDNILNLKLLSKDEFEKSIDFKLGKKNILFTYHPTTLDSLDKISRDIDNILSALDDYKDINIIFTKANSDSGGRIVNKKLEEYVKNRDNCTLFTSLGQLRYLSALQFVDAVVGNSSSGIVEAPSFKIGTINIGNRQDGRVKAKSVIEAEASKESIKQAFKILYSEEFKNILKDLKNPYYKKDASVNMKNIIKSIDLSNILNKRFKDLNCK